MKQKIRLTVLLIACTILTAQAETRMMVISDPHVLAPTLFDSTANYSGDPKLVEHSPELLDTALSRIASAAPDILLLPGDLTKDGEAASHAYVAQRLQALIQNGTQVFVIPGNHDISNPTAQSYLNGTKTSVANTDAAAFRTTYAAMGYGNATLLSPDSLSYLTWANDTLAILGLNSTQPNTTSRASAGGLTSETLNFVDSAMAIVRRHGGQVVAMMHHQLTEHFDGEATVAVNYVCNTDTNLYIPRDSVHKRLIQAGVSVMLTGHFHIHSIQHIVPSTLGMSDTLETLTDISTGALCSWPSPIRTLTLSGEVLHVSTDTIGKYQALGQARNANTVRGAINTLGPKLQAKMVPTMKSKGVTQESIDKMHLPPTNAAMCDSLHRYFDAPGLKLLNTLARGEEQLEHHMPEAIREEVEDSLRQMENSFFGTGSKSKIYGATQGILISNMISLINMLFPMAIDPILYNYVTVGGQDIDSDGSLLSIISAIASADAVRDTVPDWEHTARTIRYAGEEIVTGSPFPPTPFPIEGQGEKTMRDGVIYVRRQNCEYTIDGKRR